MSNKKRPLFSRRWKICVEKNNSNTFIILTEEQKMSMREGQIECNGGCLLRTSVEEKCTLKDLGIMYNLKECTLQHGITLVYARHRYTTPIIDIVVYTLYIIQQVICTVLNEKHLQTSAKFPKSHSMAKPICKQMLSKLGCC